MKKFKVGELVYIKSYKQLSRMEGFKIVAGDIHINKRVIAFKEEIGFLGKIYRIKGDTTENDLYSFTIKKRFIMFAEFILEKVDNPNFKFIEILYNP